MTRFLIILLVSLACLTRAQTEIKPIPPIPAKDKELAPADRAELEAAVAQLGRDIEALRKDLAEKPALQALLPDIQIYHNAVRYPLIYHELIDAKFARQAIIDANTRLKLLRDGKPDWIDVTGPRGYVSRIDRSVQPYILVVPENYQPQNKATKYRFDFWCHGRGEDLMELKFLRSKDLQPKDHFAVNLYGRYCNANKFAGEIDCLEAMDDVKKRYPVDENRMVTMGFSMGGAACWQFAVHYTDLWAAAAPGAGFSESREFLHIPQAEVDAMTPWQKALWHVYDCTDYAANLANLPTVAYSGELDGQKQATDMMEKALAAEGMKLEHLIGPGTKHAYHKETRQKLDARLAEIVAKGRNPVPDKIRFTTFTTRYNRMFWITVNGLEKHWDRARVEAEITSPTTIEIKTTNVANLEINIPAEGSKLAPDSAVTITVDGAKLQAKTNNAKGLHAAWEKWNGAFTTPPARAPGMLFKTHAMQGPIDDAFMDSFIIVKPTGKPASEKTAAWVNAECDHAIKHWQKQFRGEARVKNDTEITEADIRESNLILFGDASSNQFLAKIADRLPIKWAGNQITAGAKTFDATHHIPAFIYPNPLDPGHYIVLNSGFTFREFDYLNNARQTPKLPDYAIIDTATPVTPKAPGNIVEAGFFNEQWQLK